MAGHNKSSVELSNNNNNTIIKNNNNNTNANVYGAIIMAEPLRSSAGSFDECRTARSGRRPPDQAKRLGL